MEIPLYFLKNIKHAFIYLHKTILFNLIYSSCLAVSVKKYENSLFRAKLGTASSFFVQINSVCIFSLLANKLHCVSQFF